MKKLFVMRLKPGFESEYEVRHNPIPQDLAAAIRAHSVTSYSIFLDADRPLLYAYMEYGSEEALVALAGTEVCQRWWRHMAPIMQVNADFSPVRDGTRQVFDLSTQT
jgi:L-rhamnose mutarotase